MLTTWGHVVSALNVEILHRRCHVSKDRGSAQPYAALNKPLPFPALFDAALNPQDATHTEVTDLKYLTQAS